MGMTSFVPQTTMRIRAVYYTPMLKPLGVNVPRSKTSTIPGTAPMVVETNIANPLAALMTELTEATLMPLKLAQLREILAGIHVLSGEKVFKSGKKMELVQRILRSPHKDAAVHRFLADKDVDIQCKREQRPLKLFTSLRGALRQAGNEILQTLQLPYSVPGLPKDALPEGAHHPGECPDPASPCLMCRVFGTLHRPSLFKNYTPPLVDDPDQKLEVSREVNHVLIRTHARNMQRPNGQMLNFNQQYFAGTFVTFLQFLNGLPDPIELGFLCNCLEGCSEAGAAKAWGAGKLFLQVYTLEKVEITYTRKWKGEAVHLTRQETITPLKTELEHALEAYAQMITQTYAIQEEVIQGDVTT